MSDLHEAAAENDSGKLQDLLAIGANPNARDDEGNTPLHAAIEGRSEQAVEALIRSERTDLEAVNAEGHSPIDLAEAQASAFPDGSHDAVVLERLADRLSDERDVREMAAEWDRTDNREIAKAVRDGARQDHRHSEMAAEADPEAGDLQQAQPDKRARMERRRPPRREAITEHGQGR